VVVKNDCEAVFGGICYIVRIKTDQHRRQVVQTAECIGWTKLSYFVHIFAKC